MSAEAPVRALVLRWMMLGEWRARPGRVVVAILAIAIGVALGLAVHLVNRSALDEFARAIRTVNGEAELQVRSVTAAGFDEQLYPRLARAQGVAMVSPLIELRATAGSSRAPLTVLGLDVLRAGRVTPTLLGRPQGGAAPQAALGDDAVFLSSAALAAVAAPVGGRIDITAGGQTARLLIAGTLPGVADGQRLAVMDIAAAQWRFGQVGRLQRLDLKLVEGADRGAVATQVNGLLPPGAQIVTAESQMRRGDSLSRAYRVNLEMLAMVALLTGGFLVYSAQSLSVARRRPQFALLRVLGLQRGGMLAQVLVEGALLGVVGGLLGLALGVGLAGGALQLMGGDLGGGYFGGERPRLAFDPLASVVIFGLGLLVAVGGSLAPALDARSAQAAVALKPAPDAADPRKSPRAWPALLLLAGGAALVVAPPLANLPILGYGAMGLILAGGVAIMPWLARLLLRPLRRLRDLPPALGLAVSRLWGAPSQAAVALCGIVASTSLMIAMAVMVTSFRGSVDLWLGQLLPADLYMRLETADGAGLDPAAQRALAVAPGVRTVSFRKSLALSLSPDRPAVALIVRDMDTADPARSLPLTGRAHPVPARATPVWISEPMSRLYGYRPGQSFDLPLGGGSQTVFVAGVWRDYSRQFGTVVIRDGDYTRLTGDQLRSEAEILLAPGATAAGVSAAMRRALPAGLADRADFAEPRELRTIALQIFDRSFLVTYALEAIAVLVGLTGVAATFSAQTLARTKEFGMLRHVGVLRRQIMLMLAAEGALLGMVGAVAGAVLGVAMSQVLIHVINPQSFNWTMETRLPGALFAVLAVALTATAAGTAVLAGRGALGDGPVRAVREDW